MPRDEIPASTLWTPEDLPRPSRDHGRLIDDFATYGYCIVEAALAGPRLEAIAARLRDQAAAERRLHNHRNPANTDPVNQWVGMLLNKGEVFFDLIEHPLCSSIIAHFVGPDYVVSCVDSQIQHPGAGVMPLHTDQWWMPPPQEPGQPSAVLSTMSRGHEGSIDPRPADRPIAPMGAANVMWAISDFTEENGATRLVPRSHLSGRQPDRSVPHKVPSVPAAGPAGTAFVFDARLWHGAGANRSDSARYGITTVGCGPQFRQLETYARGLRPEVMERTPVPVLRRLGLAAWSGYGHTGDPEAEIIAEGSACLGELHDHQG